MGLYFSIVFSAAKSKKSTVVPDEGNISMLMDMSFTREQAIKALKETDNNMERAVDWIFSHPDDLGNFFDLIYNLDIPR